MNMKIKSIKTSLLGSTLPYSDNSKNGRFCEEVLIDENWPIDQHRKGPDVSTDNFKIEFKLKDQDSVSAYTIGKITFDELKTVDYNTSHIKDKLQQLCIIEHKDKVVVSVNVYDLTDPEIQKKFEEAFELARELVISGYNSNYIPGNNFGYFESTTQQPNIYSFRIRKEMMDRVIKGMSKSADNFKKLFELVG